MTDEPQADSIGAVAPDRRRRLGRRRACRCRATSRCSIPATPRLRVRTVTDRFPFPIPNGWFVVAMSDDLDPGEVRSLHYFGRDLVLYRTDDGEPRLVDAYCPHLGAHLGVGGKVEGDCIRCPFHGWTFDGDSGACVEIPYGGGERIPAKARVRAYPTIERGGAIWAWHHLTEGEPFFELPDGARDGRPGVDRAAAARVLRSRRRARRWPRTTTTSPTSSTSTAPSRSPTARRSSTAPTSR